MSRSRFSRLLDENPPAECEIFGRLKILCYESADGTPYVKIWTGKSKRPQHYRFTSAQRRQEYIDGAKASEIVSERHRAKRVAERDQSQAAMAEQLQVGTLLCYSWGYDQTNVDYFQIVKRSGRSVWIRPIGSREVPGSDHGGMSNRVMPARDKFLDDKPPIRKLIGPYGISMDFGSASPVADDEAHYQSWYA
jgi:hypothetical protein